MRSKIDADLYGINVGLDVYLEKNVNVVREDATRWLVQDAVHERIAVCRTEELAWLVAHALNRLGSFGGE
jgi:hypothetical protein